MNIKLLSSTLRHILTMGSGIFVSKGLIEPEQANAIVDFMMGLTAVIVAAGWSYKEKKAEVPHMSDSVGDWSQSPAALTPIPELKSVNGFYFGNRSRQNLKGVHPQLVELAQRMLAETAIDFTVIDGVRTLEEQRKNVAKGASTTMNSKHLIQNDGYSHAFDIAIFTADGKYIKDLAPYTVLGELAERIADDMGINFTWGGRWPNLVDASHFQLNKS